MSAHTHDAESATVTQLLGENELIRNELVAYKQLCAAMCERHSHALHSINALKAICDKLAVKWDHSESQMIRANQAICDHKLEKCDKQVHHLRDQLNLLANNCGAHTIAQHMTSADTAAHRHQQTGDGVDCILHAKNESPHKRCSTLSTNSSASSTNSSNTSSTSATTSSVGTHWNNRNIANNFSNGELNQNSKYRCEYGCNQLFARKDQMESHVRVHTSMQEAIACGHILSVVPTNSTSPTSSPTIDVTTYDRLKDNCGVGVSGDAKVSEVLFVPQVEFEVIDYHNNNSNNSANDSSLSFNNSNNNSTEENNNVNNRCVSVVGGGEKALICCDMCGKQFSKHYIQSHRRSHTGVKPYKCSYAGCERSFTQTSSRNFHEKTYHRCDKYTLFRCYYRNCDKSFARQIDLQKHVNRHNSANSNNNNNYCAQDNSGGGRAVKSRQLRRVSHRAGKHECSHCGKTFAHKVALNQHEVIHGNKEFVCHESDCDYASFWKQNLSLHLRRHHNQQ